MPDTLPDFEHECFFIAPISADDSDIRKRSNGVRDFVIAPAVESLDLKVVRADDLMKPGQITLQVIEHVLSAKAVVADLTGRNPNVYYELAVRHTARLPVVLIIEEEDFENLPFDIQQMRIIKLNHKDLASAASAKDQIEAHLEEAIAGEVDSPIATALNLQALESGTSVEKVLADLVVQVQELGGAVRQVQNDLDRVTSRSAAKLATTLLDTSSEADTLKVELELRGYKVVVAQHPDGEGDLRFKVTTPSGSLQTLRLKAGGRWEAMDAGRMATALIAKWERDAQKKAADLADTEE